MIAAPLHHLIEFLLGLPGGFLDHQGDWSIKFNPVWPAKAYVGPAVWNVLILVAAAALIVFGYREDGKSRALRISLGLIRGMLVGLVLLLLNRPMLTLGESRTEPSVLAILFDDSGSMRVPDVGPADHPRSRLSATTSLLSDDNGRLLNILAKKHQLHLYRFNGDASPLAEVNLPAGSAENGANSALRESGGGPAGEPTELSSALSAMANLKAEGSSTQLLPSILTVARDLQGQRLAGVVLLTDGRDTPSRNVSADLETLKNYGIKIYPVALGSDQQPKNIQIQSIKTDEVAFTGDTVNVKATVLATGFGPSHLVHLVLKDKKSNAILLAEDGKPAETDVNLADGKPTQVELHWKTTEPGDKQLTFEAIQQPGEIDDTDNARSTTVSVLDAKINVLFVDGYPRWDYRYLKTSLLRDHSMSVSCLLASADFDFSQEGTKPLPGTGSEAPGHFPDTLDQMLGYDVLVIGDVDPHYFSDNQLQMISEFVSRGGGLMMVAGERWSPQAYRNTPIEALLPVSISHVQPTDPGETITQGFRPLPTSAGESAGLYRFLPDLQANRGFLKESIPELFWYCQGVTAKPGVGEVLAEHPTDLGPDGHKAPLLVAGRYGGRTLFSAIDDSWRWRFYNDQHVFDSYWVQQLRYLARDRKITQRQLTLTSDQQEYELGDQIKLTLRVLDPALLRQLPAQIRVQLQDAQQQNISVQTLVRLGGVGGNGGGDVYTGSFTADRAGHFTVQLPRIVDGVNQMALPLEVILPRLELVDPRVDRIQLSRLASETFGKSIELADAAAELPLIPSAEKAYPQISSQPLSNAPLSLIVFALLLSVEWIARKLHGMV